MAKQADPKVLSVVEALQSTLVNNLAPFVFFNDPNLGKCLARVSGFPGKRSVEVRDINNNVISGGQILFQLSVDHNDMGADFKVLAAYSGDGTLGTFRLATDGDLSDHVNMKKLKGEGQPAEVVENIPVDTSTTGSNSPVIAGATTTVTSSIPGDEDGDGDVDKDDKRIRKQKNRK